MRINELMPEERPREKMLERGAAALSNSELLAVLLRVGSGSRNAVDLARELLGLAGGSLAALANMDAAKMTQVKGIGASKAVSIVVAFELGRRFADEGMHIEKVSVTGSGMIYSLMIPQMKGLDHEECWVIFLNRANFVTGRERVSAGGSSATVVDIKIILRRALEMKAESVILVHNHPSGNPRPGNADIKETGNLKTALSQVGLSLLDHVVVCDDCWFSFADEKVSFAK